MTGEFHSIPKAATALVAAGMALFFAAGPATALDKVTFSLASTLDSRSGPIFLAYDRGYFRDLGVDLEIVPGNGSANVVNKLAAGTAQMGTGDIASVVKFDILNPTQRVKAVFNEKMADLVIASIKGRSITKPEDLKGRTLGAPTGDTAYRMFSAFSAATGVKDDDVKWDHMDMAIREAMLVQGKVDAITATYSSVFFNLRSLGVADSDMVFLRYTDYGVNIVGNGWMVTEAFAKGHPETVRHMLAAFSHGWRDTMADPNAAVDATLKREPLLKRDIELAKIKMSASQLIDQPNAKIGGIGSYSDAMIKYTIGVISKAENLNPDIAVSDIIDMSFLPPIAERTIPAQTMN